MNLPINLAFEEKLVRVIDVDGEPWFVGKDVCAVLNIKNHNDALTGLDEDEKGVASTDPLSAGGAQKVTIINEPGVYRLVFRSRKPEAERFKRWLAHDVLPQIRKRGRYGPEAEHHEPLPDLDNSSVQIWRTKLDLVREARIQFGPARARLLWAKVGLPPVPNLPPVASAEDLDCEYVLGRILEHPLSGVTIADWIGRAREGDAGAADVLMSCSIRLHDTGLWIANGAAFAVGMFEDTPYRERGWIDALRRLDGAAPGRRHSFPAGQMRTTWIPAALLV